MTKGAPRHGRIPRDRRLLLNHALDALDRLFDRATNVVDVHAILFATARALDDAQLRAELREPVDRLQRILRSRATRDQQVVSALEATDGLRHVLAKALKCGAEETREAVPATTPALASVRIRLRPRGATAPEPRPPEHHPASPEGVLADPATD